MATYIPGSTDYIPQIQPFRPDYNFYAGALQMKQSQYDQGYQQVSSLYGSLLNAPMLRDNNLKARDDYFNTINRDIKKIAGLDLSKRENINAASRLFSGLYENDNIVKDMVWTRNYQKELKRADGFKNCVKPEDCGGSYWEGGIKALNYRASEFRSATDEQALGFGNVSYTPYQNVMEKAIKAAKDAGLNITVDQLQGRYITTTKNGPMLIEPLQSLFTGLFGSDPAIMDYYKTKAYVDRKDWVQGNVPQYGSIEATEQAYSEMTMQGLNALYGTSVEDLNARVNTVSGQKKQLEERIRKEGAVPDGNLAEQYRALNSMEETVQGSQRVYETSQNRYQNARDPQQSYLMGENLDQAMAYAYLSNDINQAAQTLAYKDYVFEMKADPYALENSKQANRMALESYRHSNKMALQKYKFGMKEWEEKLRATGTELDNVPILKTLTDGVADINLAPDAEYKFFKEKEGELVADLSGGEKAILGEMLSLMQSKSVSDSKSGTSGFATDDLIKFADILMTELTDPNTIYYQGGTRISNNQARKTNLERKAKWDSMTYDQKVKYAHNMDFGSFLTHPSISGTVLDNVYEKYAAPLLDMNNESNRINRNYLGHLWETSKPVRDDIERKGHLLEDMSKFYIDQSNKVISDMGTAEVFSTWQPLMQMYINPETGAKRDVNEFAESFTEGVMSYINQYNPTQAERLNDPRFYYQMAIDIYNGNSRINDPGAEDNVRKALGVDLDSVYDSFNDDVGIDQVWARAFSTYMTPEGKAMGLVGTGSQATMGLNFPAVDPSKYASEATMNTISFLSDVIPAGEEGARIHLGNPDDIIPENSNEILQSFVTQLYSDMINKKNPDDSKRPILNITYQDIAGGDEGWTAMHVKVNQPYLKSLSGTKDVPGPYTDIEGSVIDEGFTIYLNKDQAQNGFKKAVEKTPEEWTMFYTGNYRFDQYPDYTDNLILEQDDYGNYILTGSILSGYDENGMKDWRPIKIDYPGANISPTDIIGDVTGWLSQEIIPYSKSKIDEYNRANSTRDPASLLIR